MREDIFKFYGALGVKAQGVRVSKGALRTLN